jgi:hypothetical protein
MEGFYALKGIINGHQNWILKDTWFSTHHKLQNNILYTLFWPLTMRMQLSHFPIFLAKSLWSLSLGIKISLFMTFELQAKGSFHLMFFERFMDIPNSNFIHTSTASLNTSMPMLDSITPPTPIFGV